MENFLNLLKDSMNTTNTLNGGLTHKSSNSNVLDLFAQAGSVRNRAEEEILMLFAKAYAEDRILALKVLFYFRDIRGGQGERETFRLILNNLAKTRPEVVSKNIHLIPVYGRWDDLFCLLDTPLQDQVIEFIAKQLERDLESDDNISLLGKWMKSENTSSEESKRIATKLRKCLGLSPKSYRKMLSCLRKKINLVENHISSKDYSSIEYDKIPSKAMFKYKKAFERNDYERYHEFLEAVEKGEKKMNASTLFPYELVKNALARPSETERMVLNNLWNSLPDYVEGSTLNDLAVIDVSGSMSCYNSLPLYNAISLGMYIAEKNQGVFHNHFITFDSTPKIVDIKGDNFCDRVNFINNSEWGGYTNLEATFDIILKIALYYKLPQEQLPNRLIIISDMEFNDCQSYYNDHKENATVMEIIKNKFESHGYKLPKLVFWNVNSVQDNIPVTMDDETVQLVSGSNPSIFEHLIKGESLTAYDLMLQVINSSRYEDVTI